MVLVRRGSDLTIAGDSMRKIWIPAILAFTVFFAGCGAEHHAEATQTAPEGDRLTLGTVQRNLRRGMSTTATPASTARQELSDFQGSLIGNVELAGHPEGSDAGSFEASGETTTSFSGVTIDSGTQVTIDPFATLALAGTINNSGNIVVDGTEAGATLSIEGTVTLQGGGTITLDGLADAITGLGGTSPILDNLDNTIEGIGAIIGGDLTLINPDSCQTGRPFVLIIVDVFDEEHLIPFFHVKQLVDQIFGHQNPIAARTNALRLAVHEMTQRITRWIVRSRIEIFP